MNTKHILGSVALLALAGAAPTFAAEPVGDESIWTVGVSAGSLGVGPELSYRPGAHLGLRANGGFFSIDRTEELDDIEYDGEFKLSSIGLLADWYPFGGGFRVSAGARSNDNEIELNGAPTTSVQIGNTVYTPAQIGTLTGTITTDSFAPTLTLGYGGSFKSGFTVGFEVGVMFQGSPKVEDLRASGQFASNPAFAANIEREKAEIEEDARDFKYWPILQLHLLYRF